MVKRRALAEVEAALGRPCPHTPDARSRTGRPTTFGGIVRKDYCRRCSNILSIKLFNQRRGLTSHSGRYVTR
jgi:hypothetical protein